MTLWSLLTRTLFTFLAVILTACVSSTSTQTTNTTTVANSGRYTIENDIPVLEPIDLDKVRVVEPRVENRTLAGNKSPYTVNGKSYRILGTEAGYTETGIASWYGRKFHGHLTSNGEVYDMFQLSAAHTTLPIPSFVRVTNLDNGLSIVARVNDRGPFHENRLLDLSYAGAVMLGYADKGTARVKVEALVPGANTSSAPVLSLQQEKPIVLDSATQESIATERQLIDTNTGEDFLQAGVFANIDSARNLVARLATLTSMPVFIYDDIGDKGNLLHKVRIGPLHKSVPIQTIIDSVQAAGLGTPFKVRI